MTPHLDDAALFGAVRLLWFIAAFPPGQPVTVARRRYDSRTSGPFAPPPSFPSSANGQVLRYHAALLSSYLQARFRFKIVSTPPPYFRFFIGALF